MPTLCICGIDTGIGKSFVTGLMARHLLDQEKKVITQKLVQTGLPGADHHHLTTAGNRTYNHHNLAISTIGSETRRTRSLMNLAASAPSILRWMSSTVAGFVTAPL